MIKIRPGIVLTKICDQNVLVAAYEARTFCPYTIILNDTGALIWQCLKKGYNNEEIKNTLTELYDIPSELDVNDILKDYLELLKSNGYIINEECIEK